MILEMKLRFGNVLLQPIILFNIMISLLPLKNRVVANSSVSMDLIDNKDTILVN